MRAGLQTGPCAAVCPVSRSAGGVELRNPNLPESSAVFENIPCAIRYLVSVSKLRMLHEAQAFLENQVGAGFSRCPHKVKWTTWPLSSYRITNKRFTLLICTVWWFSFGVRAEARTHLGIGSARRRGIQQRVSRQKLSNEAASLDGPTLHDLLAPHPPDLVVHV
jgi:hypothetical protein